VRRYLLNLAIAWDQLLNAHLWGHPDETISSRLYRAKLAGKWWGRAGVAIVDAIFRMIGQTDHCAKSYEGDGCS
jgi:hypothetical protein